LFGKSQQQISVNEKYFHSSFLYWITLSRPRKLFGLSHICNRAIDPKIKVEPSAFEGDGFTKQIEEFTQFEWVRKNSFCWKSYPKIMLKQTLTELGVCFELNSPKVLKNQKY
jgi:hypothetical protein